ncbi:hypothetical protein TIFTF001_012023 [Ficus carica]|uniref:Secreted protein n=1 Tax=Ficus carica TaxID=3494 RepID=A0AA88D1B1_FICCA|nr:hypothetical protein TIFTF001_012023 [Ficus carica]
MLTWRVGVRGLLRLVQLASSWNQGNVPLEVPRATSGGQTPKQPIVLSHRSCCRKYGVLERVSSTGHLLWVWNGERNATLVMVVVIVPYFRMVGEVENTMCSRMNSYFRMRENSFIDHLNLVKTGCLGNGCLGR